MIAVNLIKQQALDPNLRAYHQINFAANLERAEGTRIYFILEQGKETGLDFSQRTLNVL